MLSIPSITEAEKLIEEKLGGWFDVVISHIPNFIVAVIIAIIFSFIARLAGKGMKKVLRRSLDSTQIADLMASIFKAETRSFSRLTLITIYMNTSRECKLYYGFLDIVL